MKKHIAILACLLAVFLPAVPVWGQEDSYEKCNLVSGVTKDMYTVMKEFMTEDQADIISKYQLDKIDEALLKLNALDKSNKEDWFKHYKAIQEEYSDWIDKDETIYDYFNQDELELLFRIVETEVRGDENFDEKVNVASVIFNRIGHEDFPMTLTDILTQRSPSPQFSSYISGAYKNVEVTDTTILACEYAFQIGDTTYGALYFDSTNGHSWADRNREYIFTDAVGHSFYR